MTCLRAIHKWWGNHRRGTTACRPADDAGFTIVETTMAMALVFLVLTGTLATFSASVQNLSTGRQRTGAVALARTVIEQARSSLYAQVGHDVGGDATFATDTAVTGAPKVFEGEQLVGTPDPIFAPHRTTVTNDSGSFTQSVYVTWAVQGAADPFKRITVIVAWSDDAGPIPHQVRLSSYLFEAGVPPDPLVESNADVDGGTVQITGMLAGIDLNRAVIYNPSAVGEVNSLFVRAASGQARSSSGLLEVNSGTVSGCEVTGYAAECNGIAADSGADSDASTPLPEHDVEGPAYDLAQSASAGTGLTLNLGGNDSVHTKSTARSCFSCFGAVIGDDDRLAYDWSEGTGPDSTSFGFDVGAVEGSLVQLNGASRATTAVDQDSVSDTHKVSSSAHLVMPSVDVVTVQGAPAGFVAAVQISSVDVEATAGAGPTVAAPAITSSAISVDVYDTLGGTLGYRTITVNAGEDKEESASASFDVGDNTVSLTTTVISGGKSLSSTTNSSGIVDFAEATLANWLRITVQIHISGPSGTLADTAVEFDYGRIAARASWVTG